MEAQELVREMFNDTFVDAMDVGRWAVHYFKIHGSLNSIRTTCMRILDTGGMQVWTIFRGIRISVWVFTLQAASKSWSEHFLRHHANVAQYSATTTSA